MAVLIDQSSTLDGQGLGAVDGNVAGHLHAAVHGDGIAGLGIGCCRRQIVVISLAAVSLLQCDLPHRRHGQRIGGHTVLRDLAQLVVAGHRDLHRQAVGVRHQLRILVTQVERMTVLVDQASTLDGQRLGAADGDVAGHLHAAVHNDGVAGLGVSCCRRQIVVISLAAVSLLQCDLPHRRHGQRIGGHTVLRDLAQLVVAGHRDLHRQAVGVRHQLRILVTQVERMAVLIDQSSTLDGQGLGAVDGNVAGHLHAAVHGDGIAGLGIGCCRRQIVVISLAAVSLLQHDLPRCQRVGVFRTVAHLIDIVRRFVAAYHGQRRVSSQGCTGSAGQLKGRVTGDLANTGDGQRLAHLDLAVRRHILQHGDGRAIVRVSHGNRQPIIVCRISILYIPDLVSLQRVDVRAGCGAIRHQTERAVRGLHGQCRIGGQLAADAIQQERIPALVQLAAILHGHVLCDRLVCRHGHRVVEEQRTTGLVDLGHRLRQLVSCKAGMLAVLVDDHDSAFLGKQLQRQLGVLHADHAVYLPVAGNRGRLVEGLVGRILIDAEFRLEAGQRCAVAVDIQLLQQPARSRHAAAVGRQAVVAFADSLIGLAVRPEAHADRHLQEVRAQAHSLQCRNHLRAGDLLHSGL